MAESTHITRLAEMCAARIPAAPGSFDDAHQELKSEIGQLLDTLKAQDPRYTFDRTGRPGAVAAVRGALPSIERELFDAVIEDCECELAATREALYQIARACQGNRAPHATASTDRDNREA